MEKIVPTVALVIFMSTFTTAGYATENLSAGDYIVDCSGCQYAPISDVKAYSCNVRCESKGEVDFNLRGVYDMLEARIAKLEALNKVVLFTVRLSTATSFTANSIIKYDTVTTNIGDAYSTADGKFTAPYNGTYQFTVVVMNRNSNNAAYAHITTNGDEGCASLAIGNVQYTVGTCTVILPLVAGDTVYVINPNFTSTTVYHGSFNTFTGNLIKIDG